MRIYVIRHADPDYANDTITDLGHQEAAALAERLESVRIDKIYSSPMGRAQATAGYTAKRKGMEIETLDWTAELGWRINEGRNAAWDFHGHEIRSNLEAYGCEDWHLAEPFDNPEFRCGYDQIVAESDAFLSSYGYRRDGGGYRFDESNESAVAVFCHGGFGLTWLSHLLAIPVPMVWAGFHLRPTSVTTVQLEERKPGLATPRCVGMADVSHLVMSGLEDARVPSGK
ncbi:histidine phosphatase family protein [Poriferisphaera sp. WC338]|uniref:histidine phosphatase family protein n=1 Tax=Poriferisphaera sp. WC338 TaxID=3425129 RepID=UPI003D815CA4